MISLAEEWNPELTESLSGSRWRAIADEVWTSVSDWRAAHPKATFSEIEAVVEARLSLVRTRMLEDLALESAAADITALAKDQRPRCPACAGELEARGKQARVLQTMRGDVVKLERSYTVCRACGAGVFPPG